MTIEAIEMLLRNNVAILLIAAWSLPWKGWALWRAARLKDKRWFVAILILNTLAILDIVYIFWISKRRRKNSILRGESREGELRREERISAADGPLAKNSLRSRPAATRRTGREKK